MNSVVQEIINSPNIEESEKRAMIQKLQSMYTNLDIEYLHALYFPETSDSARIPSRFGMPSSTFTQRMSFYLNTGANGNGFVGIAPQDTTFYSCFYSKDDLVNELNPASGTYSNFYWAGENGNYIPEKFSHARLVGCSMRISYIGTRDEESGFVCSSHVFTAGPMLIDEQMVENGYFVKRKRPSEGVRMVYIPKDEADLEYAPQEFRFTGSKATHVSAEEWFMASGPDADDKIQDDNELRLQVKQLAANNNYNMQWGNVDQEQFNIGPSWYWGQHDKKNQSQTPHLMVAYWRGMPANKEWLRVDVERHFEGIPRQELRDFVGVKRRGPSEATLDFVKKKSMDTVLHNHDLDDAKILERHVKPVLPAVIQRPEIVQQSPKDVGEGGFLSSLSSLAAPIMGALGGAAGLYFGGPTGALAGETAGSMLGNMLTADSGPQATKGGGNPFTGSPGYGGGGLSTLMNAVF